MAINKLTMTTPYTTSESHSYTRCIYRNPAAEYSELMSEHSSRFYAIECHYMRARRFDSTISHRVVLAVCTESPVCATSPTAASAVSPTAASEGYAHTNPPSAYNIYTRTAPLSTTASQPSIYIFTRKPYILIRHTSSPRTTHTTGLGTGSI